MTGQAGPVASDADILGGIEQSAEMMIKSEGFNQAVYGMMLVEKLVVPAEVPADYVDNHPPRVFKQWMEMQ